MPRKKRRPQDSSSPSASPRPTSANESLEAGKTGEPRPPRKPWRDPFGGFPIHWLVLCGLLAALLVSRLAYLDYMGFHHDESIHCLHSWNFVNHNQGPASYRYDPVYHGPFLYHWGGLFAFFAQDKPFQEESEDIPFYKTLLEDNDFTARLPFATIGLLIPLLFLAWARWLGWGTVLAIMALLIASPTVDYFSRFARNDVFMTAWMTGMLVFGTLYILHRRVVYLSLVSLFLALSYCTKENSYVNNFALCSFLLGWGFYRMIRYRSAGLREVLVDRLPLARVLLLYGCFAVFVFSFVAIDSRISPETPLSQGLYNIATHTTSIEKKEDVTVFQNEHGYFTASGRTEALAAYTRFAIGATLFLLLLLEGLSLWIASRNSAAGTLNLTRPFASFILAALFHGLLVWRLLEFAEWTRTVPRPEFFGGLVKHLLLDLVLLSAVAFLEIVLSLALRNSGDPDGAGSVWKSAWRASKDRAWGLAGLAAQVTLAAGVYTLLFSSLGTNTPKGTWDGLYNYLSYWFKHQTGDYRIWGTWWYYLPRLFFYELLPLTLIVCLGVFFLVRFIRTLLPKPNIPAEELRAPAELSSTPAFRLWKPIPSPLLAFALYLSLFTISIYAILNEKVPWLMTYQAYSLALLAALLFSHWLATRERPTVPGVATETTEPAILAGPFSAWLLGLFEPPSASRRPLPWWAAARAGQLFLTVFILGVALFQIGQHIATVFYRPDNPTEFLVYTQTTHDFAEQIRKIRAKKAELLSQGKTFRIAVEGDAEWPCSWYFRNDQVAWKRIDLSRDVQIANDSAETRRQMTPRAGNKWRLETCDLRGWYIWAGTPNAIPGGLKVWPNIVAFLENAPNNTRASFPANQRPEPGEMPLGFRDQLMSYAFARKIWYPTGGHPVIVGYKTEEMVSEEESVGYLAGSEGQTIPLASISSFGAKGSGPGQLLEPRGLTVTPQGKIAVADSKNGRIQIFSPSGEFLEEFGQGTLSPDVSGVSDIACSPEGAFYVADTWNQAVRKFSPQGELLTTVQQALHDKRLEGMFGPRGIAWSPKGRVYVCDTGNKKIRVYDADLKPLFSFGEPGDAIGRFKEPVGIAVDSRGDVFVADTGNGRIQKFTPQGIYIEHFLTQIPLEHEVIQMEPHLDILPDGRLAMTCSTGNSLWIVDPVAKTARLWKINQPPVPDPLGVAVGLEGHLWVTGKTSSKVVRLRIP
jgi:uncharacterized protein (TIGR03663 family)